MTMKLMSIRDLRNRPGIIQKTLPEANVALTANCRPFALVIGVDEDELVEMEAAIRRAKAQLAVSKMRRKALEAGLDAMTMDEVDAEVRAARREASER
jgi:hypothetical protein